MRKDGIQTRKRKPKKSGSSSNCPEDGNKKEEPPSPPSDGNINLFQPKKHDDSTKSINKTLIVSESKQMLNQSAIPLTSTAPTHNHNQTHSSETKMSTNANQRPYLGQTSLLTTQSNHNHQSTHHSQPSHHHTMQSAHASHAVNQPFVTNSSPFNTSIKSEPNSSSNYDAQNYGGSSSLHHYHGGNGAVSNSQYHFGSPLQHGFSSISSNISMNPSVGELSGYHHQHNVIQAAKLMASS